MHANAFLSSNFRDTLLWPLKAILKCKLQLSITQPFGNVLDLITLAQTLYFLHSTINRYLIVSIPSTISIDFGHSFVFCCCNHCAFVLSCANFCRMLINSIWLPKNWRSNHGGTIKSTIPGFSGTRNLNSPLMIMNKEHMCTSIFILATMRCKTAGMMSEIFPFYLLFSLRSYISNFAISLIGCQLIGLINIHYPFIYEWVVWVMFYL